TDGNRHHFLWLFCNNCNRKGIAMNECADYALQTFTTESEITISQSVENAYNNNKHEHAKYAKKIKTTVANNAAAGADQHAAKHNSSNANAGMVTPGRTHGNGSNLPETGKENGADEAAEKPVKFWKERTITK